MTTVTRNGVEFDVVYIDPSAGSAGDGSAYDSPLLDIPSTIENQKCYLVRRTSEDYMVDMKVGNYSGTIFNFMIMGMPKSTDEEWKYLNDADVKSAWGSDTAEYANIRWNSSSYGNNTSYSFYTTYLQNMFITRCYLFRDGNSGWVGADLNPMIFVDYGDEKSNVYFNYCKFGFLTFDLDDSTWRENNSDFDTTNNNHAKLENYFYGSSLKSFIMDNCIINAYTCDPISNQEWYRKGKPFKFDNKAINVEIKNTKIYSTWGNMDTYYEDTIRNSNVMYFYYQPRNLKLYNLELNSVMKGTSNIYRGFFYCRQTNSFNESQYYDERKNPNIICITNVKNIIVNFIKMKDANPSGVNLEKTWGRSVFNFNGLSSYNIDTITVNGNLQGSEMCGAECLIMSPTYRSYSGLCKRSIKNIKINFETDYTKLKYWTPTTSTLDINPISIALDRQQYTIGDSDYLYNGNRGMATLANYAIIENIEINAPFVRSYFNCCNIKNAKLNTYITFGDRTSAEVDYLSNYFPSQPGFQVGELSYVRIKEYAANLNSPLSTYNGESQIITSLGNDFLRASDIYIDKSNVSLIPENTIVDNLPGVYSNNLICPNYLSNNQYIQLAKNGYMKSWNTVRTGSTSLASIKCNLVNGTLTSGVEGYGITLGTRPYKGIQIEPSTTGNQTLKVYIAYKGFNQTDEDNLLDKVFVEAEVPNNGFGTNDFDSSDIYDSRADGYISDDSSVWSNDTGLTMKVINIPLNVIRTDKPINVRITYEVEGSTKYMYIDPDLKLV